ncbi:MAG: TonB-dependent receptor, partial [Alphaproteobacteria bacterium]
IANPSVSFHIDGVYTASDISLNSDFLDVERIEILRGPQGTVFGQNSTGGAINLITKQPRLDAFEGQADLTLGSFDHVRARAAINVPVNDMIAARGSFSYFKHDGFTRNLALPGVRLDEDDNFAGRLQLLFQPTERFSATLRAQFFTTDVNDRAQKNILDPTPNPRQLRQDFPGTFMFESQIYSAELRYDLDFASIKSITSYQDEEENQSRDTDRSDGFFQPSDIVPDRGRTIETVTQEINITSTGEQPIPLDWILGFFYLDTETNVRFLEFADFNFDGVIDTTIDTSNPFSNPDLGFQTSSRPTRESWSLYAQGTYHILDNLRLVGGLRYTDDAVKSQVFNFFATTPQILETSVTKLTGKVAVEFDIAEQNMLYASWTRGFKPGGANLTFGTFVDPIYDSEEIDAIEIGSKNQLLDNRLRLNVAAFYYDYTNFQFQNTDPVPFNGGVDNIPESEVYGIEGELSALVTNNFRLDGNFAYLDTKVSGDAFVLDSVAANNAQNALLAQGFGLFSPEVIAARTAAIQNIRGNKLPKTPDFTANVNATYSIDVADYGTVITTVQYTYRGKMNFRLFDNPVTDKVPSYDLWNINVRWEPVQGNWALEFLVINLEDDAAGSIPASPMSSVSAAPAKSSCRRGNSC